MITISNQKRGKEERIQKVEGKTSPEREIGARKRMLPREKKKLGKASVLVHLEKKGKSRIKILVLI